LPERASFGGMRVRPDYLAGPKISAVMSRRKALFK